MGFSKYKYEICGKEFKSKKSLIDYIRNIRNSYQNTQAISDNDLNFMIEVLKYHEYAAQKIGCGVKKMWVNQDPFGTRCFWLERNDGTSTDFSFHQCLSPANLMDDFRQACRNTIAPLIVDFKKDFFKDNHESICPINGEKITFYHSHVDHVPPNTFEVILSQWIEFMKKKGFDIKDAPITEHKDGKVSNSFSNEKFKAAFIAFHNKRATLRVISPAANLSITKKLCDGLTSQEDGV